MVDSRQSSDRALIPVARTLESNPRDGRQTEAPANLYMDIPVNLDRNINELDLGRGTAESADFTESTESTEFTY